MMQEILKLESILSDGVQVCTAMRNREKVAYPNVQITPSADISSTLGMLSTGLRCSALIPGESIYANLHSINQCARRKMPLVIHTWLEQTDPETGRGKDYAGQLRALESASCFQFIAHSLEEHIHFTLLAHRIAELSLVPGIIIAEYPEGSPGSKLPDQEQISLYLGKAEDQIKSPTPAQEMVFGKERRRIPAWFDMQVPVLIGSEKDRRESSFESAATRKYFLDHIPEIITRAAQEYKKVTGFHYAPATVEGHSKQYAVVSFTALEKNAPGDSRSIAKKAVLIKLHQVKPFPIREIRELLEGKKALTIIQHTGLNIPGLPELNAALHSGQVFIARTSAPLSGEAYVKIVDHMISGSGARTYYLDIPFTKKKSDFPKHRIRLQEIESAYPEVTGESLVTREQPSSTTLTQRDEIPGLLQNFAEDGPGYARLAPFYDHTAFFYKHGLKGEIVADPGASIPVLPPASASFLNESRRRENIPVFLSDLCTGCGDCFTFCPHAALPPVVTNVEALLKTGMESAAAGGKITSALTPVIKNLARLANQEVKDGKTRVVRDFLPGAFEKLMQKMNPDDQKRETLAEAFSHVMETIGDYPVAVTDTFHKQQEASEKGSGSLFSVNVNPVSCTGCSICADVCPENALEMQPQDEAILQTSKRNYSIWEALPDTPGQVISRLHANEGYSSLAAILLSRNYYSTLNGGGYTGHESGAMTMVHIVSSVTESVIQPGNLALLQKAEGLVHKLRSQISEALSQALPTENIAALSSALHKATDKGVYLQDLIENLNASMDKPVVDAEVLGRKTDMVSELENLLWLIKEGPNGIGRSRFGLVLYGPMLEWAARYPANHFTNPCIIQWNGSSPDHVIGLCRGEAMKLVDQARILRKAELELQGKLDNITRLELKKLGYADLTEEERSGFPPILLFIDRQTLLDQGWSGLQAILSEPYPVKVFILDHGVPSKAGALREARQLQAGMLSTMAMANAFIYQGALGNAQDLLQGLADGIADQGPALFHLYSIMPDLHRIKSRSWKDFEYLSANSRAFPSFRYAPKSQQDFLKGALDIEMNPQWKMDWVTENIDDGSSKPSAYTLTWADWAFTLDGWEDQFTKAEPSPDHSGLHDLLALPAEQRRGRIPVIARSGKTGKEYYEVSKLVTDIADEALAHWRSLQELAGMRVAHPQRFRKEITKELTAAFDQEKQAIIAEYEEKIRDLENRHAEVFRQKLKESLVNLSRMGRGQKERMTAQDAE